MAFSGSCMGVITQQKYHLFLYSSNGIFAHQNTRFFFLKKHTICTKQISFHPQ